MTDIIEDALTELMQAEDDKRSAMLSVHVVFVGKAAFLPKDECVSRAQSMFPKMKVFNLHGQNIFECRSSKGTIQFGKSVCLYLDIPDNPIWGSGFFADSVVVKE